MDEKLIQSLQDYVATYNSGKYNSWEELDSKFPELSNYGGQVLQDYVATYNSGKYEDWATLNAQFPEFTPQPVGKQEEVSGQGLQNTSVTSTEPLEVSQPTRELGQVYPDQIRTVSGVSGDVSYNIITDNNVSPQALEQQGIKEPVYNTDGSLLYDPTGTAIQAIPETDLPVLRDIEEVVVTATVPKLAAGQSIKNSFSNLITQLRGFDDRLSIFAPEAYKKIFGAYMGINVPEPVREAIANNITEGFYGLTGRDVNADIQTSYQNLAELEQEVLPTNQIIDSYQNNDLLGTASAVVDGAFSLLGTALVSAPTLGAGLVTEMAGGALYDANVAKAEMLGTTVEDLYNTNRETVEVPMLIGGIGAGLEAIGLRGVTNAISRRLGTSAMRNFTTIGIETNKEGLTELIQSGLEEVNTTLAEGGTEEDAVESFANFVTSKQGLEVYLKALAGSATSVGAGRLSNGVVNRANRQQINQRTEQLDNLLGDLTDNQDPVVTNAIIDRAEQLSVEIQDLKDSDASVISNLDDDTIVRVGEITNEMSQIQNQIDTSGESNLTESTREALEVRLDNLQLELDTLTEQQDGDNQETNQTPVADTQVAPVGEEGGQSQELVVTPEQESVVGDVDQATDTVQQEGTFSENEQADLVNTLATDQSFLTTLSDSAQRTARIQELEQRIRANVQSGSNLGISQDPLQNANEGLNLIRDFTEYAVLRIADGTIKTANALADALGVERTNPDVQTAFTNAQEINRIVSEATVTPARQTTKSTIRQATEGRIQGTVQLTNREALTQRIRTLNEGARLGKRAIQEARQGVTDLINDLSASQSFRGKVNLTALRRVARSVNNANTEAQVARATAVVEKVVDDAKFAQRLADIDNYKARMSRIAKAKSTPRDLGRVLNEFSKINPRDLEVAELDEYLQLAESIYRRQQTVSNVNNNQLQKLIDIANANNDERRLEREARRQTLEAQQLKLVSLRDNLVERLGVEASVVNSIDNGSRPLDEVIVELQGLVDAMRTTREEQVRTIADEYSAEIQSNRESILSRIDNTAERRLVEEFLDLNSTETAITKPKLGNYVTTLYNLLNNASGVGLGDIIVEIKRNRSLADTAQVENLQSYLVTPSKLFQNLNAGGATSGSQAFDAIVSNKENTGDLHEFTGFMDVQIKSVEAQKRIETVKQDFNKLVARNSKDLNNNPQGEVLMSIYADVVQYRENWTAEEIANEYNLRIQAWGESLGRMKRKAETNSEYNKVNKFNIDNLEKVLNSIASSAEVDGKLVWSPTITSEEMYNRMSTGHKEMYNFMRSAFSELQAEHFATSRVYGGLDVETDWVNYFPRNYTSIPSTSELAVNRSLASATGRIQDADAGASFNQSLTKENTGTGKSRLISGDKLPLNRALNTKAIDTFLQEVGGIIYDVETMAERKYTSAMLDFERNGLTFEDEVPMILYKEKVAQKILGDKFSIGVGELRPTGLKRIFAKISRLGTAVALGGATQFIKQVTPLVETFGRVSNPKHVWTAMEYLNNEDASKIMAMGDIALRNIENEITVPTGSNPVVSTEQTNEVLRALRQLGIGADQLSDQAVKLSLAPIKITDNAVARIGWLALYIDRTAQRNGGVVDFTKIDRNAIAYANTQNSIVMNESDPAMQGKFLRVGWVRMMFPFSSFSINAKITMLQAGDRLIKAARSGDKEGIRRHSSQLVSNLANIALFNAIGTGIRYGAISSGGYFLASIIGNSDTDEEEKKELLEQLEKDTTDRLAMNNMRSVGYLTQDFLFGGLFGKYLEPATEFATDFAIRSAYGDDELRARGFSNVSRMANQEWYEPIFAVMGTAGIYGQRVADTWKLASDIGESDKDYVTRRFREVNALRDDVVIDSWYLDPANIDKYSKPEWERASTMTATLMSMMSLTGLSDQWAGSTRRYMTTLSRNLLTKDHGKVSKQSKKELIEASKRVTQIDVGGASVPLDYDQKIWYYNEYFNTVLEQKTKIPKQTGMPETMYESTITSLSESLMKIKFLEKYPELFKKSVNSYIRDSKKDAQEQANKLRYYNR